MIKKNKINIEFNSKAKTLEDLIHIIKSASILPITRFTVDHYQKNKNEIIDLIQSKFMNNIIIRSSSMNEDNPDSSNAGEFTSILDVDIKSRSKIINSIDKVVDSFGSKFNAKDEIFIQTMLKNVDISGVIFSSDIDTLCPYYIINYDRSGSTNSITSGVSNNHETYISFKHKNNIKEPWIKDLLSTSFELETIFNNNFIDIEFAFVKQKLYVLQVRPIVTKGKQNLSNLNLKEPLRKLHKKIPAT